MQIKFVTKVVDDLDLGKSMLVAVLCSMAVALAAAAYNDFDPNYEVTHAAVQGSVSR
jgi:hypothetical protein